MAFFTDAIAHASLLGVGAGLLMGFQSQLWPMLVVAVVVSTGVWALRRNTRQSTDTILGVLMTGSLALGVVLYLEAKTPRDLHSYLFGDLVTLPASWFPWICAASIGVMVCSVMLFNRAALLAVSEDLLRARAERTVWAEGALVALLALVVTLGVRTLGILMINALLIVPGALAGNLSRRLSGFFWISTVSAMVAAFVGLTLSYSPEWPPGPSVVLVLVGMYLLTLLVRRRA
jgi:zinc transport system permease protein